MTPRICGLHWAYHLPGMCLWAAVLPDGRLYLEHEYVFTDMIAIDVARQIVEVSAQRGWHIESLWANPAKKILKGKIGEDPFETFQLAGLPLVRSRHDPAAGWQRVQHWLRPMPNGSAALIVSPDCETVIKSIPQLLQSKTDLELVDESGTINAARALRYLVMSRPAPPAIGDPTLGRDLSRLDPKTRADIERVALMEQAEDARVSLDPADPSYPHAEMFDRTSPNNLDGPF